MQASFTVLPPTPVVSPAAQNLWGRWGVRTASIATTALSLAGRLVNYAPWLNGVSSLGVGLGVQAFVDSFCTRKQISRWHSITGTATGAFAMLAATQVYDNVTNVDVQGAMTAAIVGCLGAQVAMYVKQAVEHHFLRVVENTTVTARGTYQRVSSGPKVPTLASLEKFREIFLGQNGSDCFRVVGAGVAGTVLCFTTDPVTRGIAFFFLLYYPAAIAGGRVATHLDNRIAQANGPSEWRTVKVGINTVAFIYPVCFVTTNYVGYFPFLGGAVGFLDEFLIRCIVNRLQNVPISKLEELRPLARSLARRVSEVGIPVVVATAFGIWQVGWDLDDQDSQIACGMMTGSFVTVYGACKMKNYIWDRDTRMAQNGALSLRTRVRDLAICQMKFTPRCLGVSIPIYFFLITNALKMDDQDLEGESQGHRFLIMAGYTALGAGTAFELDRNSEHGVWHTLPLGALLMGTRTFEQLVKGEIS